MRQTLIRTAVAAALVAPLATFAQQPATPATAAQARSQTMQPMAILASEMIGKDVVNSRGEDLGEVRDLVIDINNNRVHYAMLDLQGKHFAYPMRALGFTADKSDVVLNVSEERLERAPGLDERLWKGRDRQATITNSDYERDWDATDKYWRDDERAAGGSAAGTTGTTGGATGTAGSTTGATGTTGPTVTAKPRRDMQLVWASKLLGWNVHNQANNDSIGEIKEIVVRPSDGKVHFVAVEFNEKVGGADKALWDDRLHPLPLDAFATREGQDDLVLTADRSKLQAAQGLDEDQLEDRLADPGFIEKAAQYADQVTPAGAAGAQK